MALSRIIVGIILITPTIIGLFVPGWEALLLLIAAAFIAVGTGEFYWMAIRRGYSPHYIYGLAASLAIYGAGIWLYGKHQRLDEWLLLIVVFIAGAFVVHLIIRGYYDAIGDIATTITGPLYACVPITLAVLIFYFDKEIGRTLIFYLFLTVWISDTGAYVIGKNFGRRRMSPLVSPKKTWEGAIGGLIVPLPVAIGFWMFSPMSDKMSLLGILLLTIVICVIAIVADLGESALKRDAGVKDSGTMFKEMGGALDIMDSFLFCAPALYIVHHFFIR